MKWLVGGGLAVGILFLILIIVILHLVLIPGSHVEQLQNCTSDHFSLVSYVIDLSDPESQKYIAIRIDEKSPRQLFNFSEGLIHCQSLDSKMWEVLDGEPEWNAVMNHTLTEEPDRTAVWLNASPLDPNPPPGDEVRLQSEAKAGRGLPVSWGQTQRPAEYSRFIGGDSSECLTVAGKFWRSTPCSHRYHVACIKRNCAKPQ